MVRATATLRRLAAFASLASLASLASFAGSCKGGGASVSLEAACQDLAQSQCDEFKTCSPETFDWTYGDVGSCVARMKLTCPIIASASGSGYTGNGVEACANALAATSCADIANNVGVAACEIRGTLPVGSGCIDDAQCAGKENFCKLSTDCGVCAPRKPASDLSDPFSNGDCAANGGCLDGLVCNLGHCIAVLPPNATCDLSHPCQAPYACVGGACSAPTLGPGATCDIYESGCDPSQRLHCLAELICGTIPTAHLGETCGLMGNLVTTCVGGTVCNVLNGDYLGVCVAPLADGSPCDPAQTVYDQCQPPASCTGGFCNLPEPLACAGTDAGTD